MNRMNNQPALNYMKLIFEKKGFVIFTNNVRPRGSNLSPIEQNRKVR